MKQCLRSGIDDRSWSLKPARVAKSAFLLPFNVCFFERLLYLSTSLLWKDRGSQEVKQA